MSDDRSLALAFVVIAIKSPFLILGYMFKHKALLLVSVVAVVAIIVMGTVNSNKASETLTPQYQVVTPSIAEAPYVVATSSRTYYVIDYTDDGKVLTMNRYYDYNKKWVLEKIPLALDRSIFGEIRIFTR